MKLTLEQARKQIADREEWLWNKQQSGIGPSDERDFCDQDYPGPGLEDLFWGIPNQ